MKSLPLIAALALSATSATADDMRFDNIAISVSDIDTSAAWYADTFGFEIAGRTFFEPVNAQVAFLHRDDVKLELLEIEGAAPIPELLVEPPAHLLTLGYKAIVFRVADLAAFDARVRATGTTIVWESLVLDDAGTVSTLLRDPDGNLVNVFGGLE